MFDTNCSPTAQPTKLAVEGLAIFPPVKEFFWVVTAIQTYTVSILAVLNYSQILTKHVTNSKGLRKLIPYNRHTI